VEKNQALNIIPPLTRKLTGSSVPHLKNSILNSKLDSKKLSYRTC